MLILRLWGAVGGGGYQSGGVIVEVLLINLIGNQYMRFGEFWANTELPVCSFRLVYDNLMYQYPKILFVDTNQHQKTK